MMSIAIGGAAYHRAVSVQVWVVDGAERPTPD
jgi:hypothetical protein